jgi:hypothetical protein
METKCINYIAFELRMIDGTSTTRRVEMGGHERVKKRSLNMRCANSVPAWHQHERTHATGVLRKSKRLEKIEKRSYELIHKIRNNIASKIAPCGRARFEFHQKVLVVSLFFTLCVS